MLLLPLPAAAVLGGCSCVSQGTCCLLPAGQACEPAALAAVVGAVGAVPAAAAVVVVAVVLASVCCTDTDRL